MCLFACCVEPADQALPEGATGVSLQRPLLDKTYHPVSGEEVNWQEINLLIQQVSQEMDMDAKKAIESLKKDDMLLKRLNRLRMSDGKKPIGANCEESRETEVEDDDTDEDDEENEERATKNLIQQVKAKKDLTFVIPHTNFKIIVLFVIKIRRCM